MTQQRLIDDRAAEVFNGTYTISNPGTGEHRTFRIATANRKGPMFGERIVSLLSGPDNNRDFTGFAFIDDEAVVVWKRFRSEYVRRNHPFRIFPLGRSFKDMAREIKEKRMNPSKYEIYAATIADLLSPKPPASGLTSQGFQVEAAAYCLVCNRKLTTPDSLARGIGPDCAARSGR